MSALRSRLRALPRWYRHYGGWKVRLDPVYAVAMRELEDAREVVDLGSGMGLMEALLAGRGPRTRIRGLEWDARKAAVARRLTAGLPNVMLETCDARTAPLGTPDAILLVDLLHYFPRDEQAPWLGRCAAALAPGGLLFIRDLDASGPGRGAAALIERFAVAFGWNRAARVLPWAVAEMGAHLEGLGLRTEVRALGRGPFAGNALVLARKPPLA